MMRKILLCAAIAVVAGCKYAPENGTEPVVPFSGERVALPGAPYGLAPTNAELLDESGELALFSGETAADVAYNETQRNAEPRCPHNSLFLRRRGADGSAEWQKTPMSAAEVSDLTDGIV